MADIENFIKEFSDSRYDSIEISNKEQSIKLRRTKREAQVEKLDTSNDDFVLDTSEEEKGLFVKAKRVGFFYSNIRVGDVLKAGNLVGQIKSMNIKHELRSNIDGRVKKILVEDGHGVQYDDCILEIEA